MNVAGSNARSPIIIIAAGGTGGHIFPAIATGRKIQELEPGVKIVYACGERPLEISLYERNGITPVVFPSRQIRPGILGKIRGISAAAGNVFRAMRWVREIRADLVVGFGGYVAGPTVLGAKLAGCRTAIHEANSVPGRTNRILGPWMDLTASHFEDTLKKLGGKNKVAVGMPVRSLDVAESKFESRRVLGLDQDMDTILILGGSQGARFLYDAIMALLPQIDNQLDRPVQILWSAGEKHLEHLQSEAEKLSLQRLKLHLVPFIADMGNALNAADLAVARAGASTMAELTAFRIFTIYVPFLGAIYDHQTLNALEAERFGLGKVIQERGMKTDFIPTLLAALKQLDEGNVPAPPSMLDSSMASDRLAEELLKLMAPKGGR